MKEPAASMMASATKASKARTSTPKTWTILPIVDRLWALTKGSGRPPGRDASDTLNGGRFWDSLALEIGVAARGVETSLLTADRAITIASSTLYPWSSAWSTESVATLTVFSSFPNSPFAHSRHLTRFVEGMPLSMSPPSCKMRDGRLCIARPHESICARRHYSAQIRRSLLRRGVSTRPALCPRAEVCQRDLEAEPNRSSVPDGRSREQKPHPQADVTIVGRSLTSRLCPLLLRSPVPPLRACQTTTVNRTEFVGGLIR